MTEHRVPIDPFKAKSLEKKRSEEERRFLVWLSNAYKKLFDEPQTCTQEEARAVYRDLHDYCMTFDETMTGNSWTYHNLGKQAVGRHLFQMREYGIEQELVKMRNETYKSKEQEK